MPIYINIVRHPVDRVYAWYYYIRAPWYVPSTKPKGVVVKKTANNIKKPSVTEGNVTQWDRTIPQKEWKWKKGRIPNIRFLKTSYIDCVKNKYYECLHMSGMPKLFT